MYFVFISGKFTMSSGVSDPAISSQHIPSKYPPIYLRNYISIFLVISGNMYVNIRYIFLTLHLFKDFKWGFLVLLVRIKIENLIRVKIKTKTKEKATF